MLFAKIHKAFWLREGVHFTPARVRTPIPQEYVLLPPKNTYSCPLKVRTLATPFRRLVKAFYYSNFLFLYDYKQITI